MKKVQPVKPGFRGTSERHGPLLGWAFYEIVAGEGSVPLESCQLHSSVAPTSESQRDLHFVSERGCSGDFPAGAM